MKKRKKYLLVHFITAILSSPFVLCCQHMEPVLCLINFLYILLASIKVMWHFRLVSPVQLTMQIFTWKSIRGLL